MLQISEWFMLPFSDRGAVVINQSIKFRFLRLSPCILYLPDPNPLPSVHRGFSLSTGVSML